MESKVSSKIIIIWAIIYGIGEVANSFFCVLQIDRYFKFIYPKYHSLMYTTPVTNKNIIILVVLIVITIFYLLVGVLILLRKPRFRYLIGIILCLLLAYQISRYYFLLTRIDKDILRWLQVSYFATFASMEVFGLAVDCFAVYFFLSPASKKYFFAAAK